MSVPAPSVPRTMMLADLDGVVLELLRRELAATGISGVGITFDAPSRERSAEWPSPAINLFLYDLRESPKQRDRTWQEREVNGAGMLVRPPLHLDCTYAITAWTQSALDEHRLLSQVVAILCAHTQLPPDLLPASLLVGDPPHPLLTRIAHVRDDARADFWMALGGQYKVSLEYTVTVLCDPGVAVGRGAPVQTQVLTTGGVGSAAGMTDTTYTAGGEVRDADGHVLPGIAVSLPALGLACPTDDEGRFRLRAVPPGSHAVQARGPAGELATAELHVPGDGVVLTLPLDT